MTSRFGFSEREQLDGALFGFLLLPSLDFILAITYPSNSTYSTKVQTQGQLKHTLDEN